LEIDLTLSGNVALNNATGYQNYGWALNYASPIAPGADFGNVQMELLESGVPITPLFGFDLTQPFASPEVLIGTGTSTVLPPNLVFNGVDIFVSNANPETLLDVEVGLPVVVPEPTTIISGALLLLPFGSSAVRQLRKKLQAA
jgi:hypothetical protein